MTPPPKIAPWSTYARLWPWLKPYAPRLVLVADPNVASYLVPGPGSVFLFAEGAGTTTLYALDAQDQVIAALRQALT